MTDKMNIHKDYKNISFSHSFQIFSYTYTYSINRIIYFTMK